jgi:CheY-like chemotaxis protein
MWTIELREPEECLSLGPMVTASSPNAVEHRVLVIDDNLDLAHSFANMVERMGGHKVAFAINGYAALELAKKFRPDVVFLDLMMPGINGFEVARRLKRHFGDAIRIIAVTAHGAEKDRQQSAKAGFELHLLKPVDPSVIQSLLA